MMHFSFTANPEKLGQLARAQGPGKETSQSADISNFDSGGWRAKMRACCESIESLDELELIQLDSIIFNSLVIKPISYLDISNQSDKMALAPFPIPAVVCK